MHLVRKYNPFKRAIGSESPSSSTRRLTVTTTPSGGTSVGLHPVETNIETTSSTVAGCIGKRSKSAAAEKELQHLSNKIDKLLANLDDGGKDDVIFANGDECVICLSAKASMQTQPCGHRVVCRLCFVKTIQATVSQRTLPLRCVVCRTKILKLKQTTPPSRTPSTPSSGPFRLLSESASVTSSGLVTFRPQRSRSSVPGPIASWADGVSTSFGAAATGVCIAQGTSASIVGSSPRHASTATKLIQPLLIYPTSSVPQSTSSSTYHCGHHRLPPNHHHHHHHGNQAQQQQQQQPRRVMAAWCGDGTSFDTSLEPASTTAAPGVDISGNGGGSGSSTQTTAAGCGHLHRRTDVGDMERGRGRGVRVNGLVRTSGESSPAMRRLASVSGNQSNSSNLPSHDRR